MKTQANQTRFPFALKGRYLSNRMQGTKCRSLRMTANAGRTCTDRPTAIGIAAERSLRMTALALIIVCTTLLQAQTPLHVTPTGTGNGTSWLTATSLENAVSTAQTGTIIWVQAGEYLLNNTLEVPAGTLLYGGFAGTESRLEDRNYAERATILDGQDAVRVVTLGDSAVLNGFTVRNGAAISVGQYDGGAVWMSVNAKVENCHILNSRALDYGGGIYAVGNGLIFGTVISGNRAGIDGLAVYGTTVTLLNNTITRNYGIDCDTDADIDWGEWVITPPNCTTTGDSTRTCLHDPRLMEVRPIPALGHDWQVYGTGQAPTCTQEGFGELKCSRCDEISTSDIVPALGHDEGAWHTALASTCTEAGYRELRCTRCDYLLETEAIPVLGHDIGDPVIVAPTCTEDGSSTISCSRCDYEEVTPLFALGHDWQVYGTG